MNNKGFTLIELLVTIVLLGVIAMISFVSVNAVIEKSKEKNCENQKSQIIVAAKEYVSDNRYKSNINSLTVETLISNNYLKNMEIKNPYTNQTISPNNINLSVSITNDNISITISPDICQK